jgi:hypothetical protein
MLLVVLALPLFLAKTAFAENSAPASFAYSVSGMKIPSHNRSFQFPDAGMFKPWMVSA